METALKELPTIEDVHVSIGGGNGKVCSHDGSVTQVTFLRDLSRQSAYRTLGVNSTYLTTAGTKSAAVVAGGGASTINTGLNSVVSTKVTLECSGRGTCNAGNSNTGECTCYGGYHASDGRNQYPTKEHNYKDCGYERLDYNWTMGGFPDITCPIVAPQWGGSASICGGVGTCANKVCTCNAGYEGGACEWLSCPQGTAWWDKPTAPTVGHALAKCSNRGKCYRKTGLCACEELFADSATCSVMGCAKNESYVCGDKGVCMTMNKVTTEFVLEIQQ